MKKLISLDLDYSIKVSSRVHDYLNPDFIFLPITSKSKYYKNKDTDVLKGELIIDNHFSSVSGKIKAGKNVDGHNYIVITNDYKEKNFNRSISNIKKIMSIDDINNILDKFKIDFSKKGNTLVVNLVEDEPYILNKSMYFKNNVVPLLETIDFIRETYRFDSVILLLKNIETELLTKLNSKIGTYPYFNIITVPNLYLISLPINYCDHIGYNINDITDMNILTLRKIYNALYKNKSLTEKYITITGNAIKNPLVINTKLGVRLSDLLLNQIKLKSSENIEFYLNGLMKGTLVNPNNVIVDENINGLIITYKEPLVKEENCIKCGLCKKYCPLGIDPIKKMKTSEKINCLNCGLCTYICPSNIDFKKICGDVKNEE